MQSRSGSLRVGRIAEACRTSLDPSIPRPPAFGPPFPGFSQPRFGLIRESHGPDAQARREVEALFEAVVQPSQSRARQQERIDGTLSRALGDGKSRFQSGLPVSAFGDVKEKVRRGTETERGTVVIEGVNLAARTARKKLTPWCHDFTGFGTLTQRTGSTSSLGTRRPRRTEWGGPYARLAS